MKAMAVVLMCFIFSFQSYSQDACSSLDKESEKIRMLKSKLKENYRKNLYDDLLKASGNAAKYYEQCVALKRNLSPTELLPAYYQIGKYYYDAGSCERSNAYFRKCLALSTVSSQKFNATTRTYKEIISDRLKEKQCYNTGSENNAGLKLVTSKFSYHDGKALYVPKIAEQTNELPEGKNNSSVPYFADEIDLLQSRVYNLRDSVRAIDSLKKIAGSIANYRMTGPFLLVNVNSPFSNEQSGSQADQNNQSSQTNNIAVQSMTKDTRAKSEENQALIGNSIENGSLTVGSVNAEIKVIQNVLSDSLFKGNTFGNLMPVYLYNGAFSPENYKGFLAFAEKVHFRDPGKKIGYYNAFDKSVMVWLSSGYGTLAHEVYHLLLKESFPDIPHWLDEGIASLNEETSSGKPLDNWRLVYIKAFKDKYAGYISLKHIIEDEQTNTDAGMLYDCFDRYFCKYAYERGKLLAMYNYLKVTSGHTQDLFTAVFGADSGHVQQDFYQWLDKQALPERWRLKSFEEQVAKNIEDIPIDSSIVAKL